MHLPYEWEKFLNPYMEVKEFYKNLHDFVERYTKIIPRKKLIFNVFSKMDPSEVRCVLYGEDPYPRRRSANGIAFWDAEIKSWEDRTNGNALKNILKALLVAQGKALYTTSLAECRTIAQEIQFQSPSQLFGFWLKQGVLLVNVALTYSAAADKKNHFNFWQPFHSALIRALNAREQSPSYVLWGRKAWQWEEILLQTIDQPSKIIKQGHPTFIHQFLNPARPSYSPFKKLEQETGINWSSSFS